MDRPRPSLKPLQVLQTELQRSLRDRDWPAGANLIREWCERRPDDPKGWYYRAYVSSRLGRTAEARTWLDKSLSLSPDLKEAKSLLASLSGPVPTHGKARPALSSTGWTEGSLVRNRYEIKGVKRGGMGEVHFAFDRELDRMVAIKTPLPAVLESPNARARFFREAEAWIGLGIHPNICAAYYVQDIGGLPRLFIEYVAGGSLEDWLKIKTLSFREKLDLAIQIASGMHHTHTFPWRDESGAEHRGLVHRDLKPANILMNPDGLARVTDFGLVGLDAAEGLVETGSGPETASPSAPPEPATPASTGDGAEHWHTMTSAGQAMGTPPYMAPEQFRGAHLAGPPADVYAFGCILYEIFRGRRPYYLTPEQKSLPPGIQMYHWQQTHARTPPPDPNSIEPGLDGELASLMMQCLAKSPKDRPADFQNLRDSLKSIYRRVEGWRAPLRPDPKPSALAVDTLNNHGVSFIALGQKARAERAWREALEIDPHHLEATFNLTLFEWRAGGLTEREALIRLNEAARTHAGSWRCSLLLGRWRLHFGRPAEAVETLSEAMRLEKAEPGIWKELGLALCADPTPKDVRRTFSKAEKLLHAAIEKGYDDRETRIGLAYALRQLERDRDALRWHDLTAGKFPDLPPVLDDAVHRHLPGHEILFAVSGRSPVLAASLGEGCREARLLDSGGISSWEIHPLDAGERNRTAVAPGLGRPAGLSRDGRIVLVVGESGLRLVDVASGQAAWQIDLMDPAAAAAALSPNGEYVAIAGGNRIEIVSAAGIRLREFDSGSSPVVLLAVADDGAFALSAHEDCGLRVFGGDSVMPEFELRGHEAPVTALALEPEARRAVSGSRSGELIFWDLETGGREKIIRFADPVEAAAFSPDGRALLAAEASPDGGRLTLLANPMLSGRRLPYVTAAPRSAAEAEALEKQFRDNLERAVSCFEREYFSEAFDLVSRARAVDGYGRHAEAMDFTGRLAALFPNKRLLTAWRSARFQAHENGPVCLAVVPDNRAAVSGGPDEGLKMWDLDTGREIRRFPGSNEAVIGLGLDPSGKRLAALSRDGRLRLWDTEKGQIRKIVAESVPPGPAPSFSPDGRFLLAPGPDDAPRVLDIVKSEALRVLKGHRGPVHAAGFAPDGRQAVTAGHDGRICLWDLHSGKVRLVLEGHAGPVFAASFSPDGRYVLSAGADGTARRHDLSSDAGQKIFRGHDGAVRCAVWHPEGRHILTGGDDRTLRLWDVQSGACLAVLEGHASPVASADFAPDGQKIISAGDLGEVCVWRLDWEPDIRPLSFWDEEARPFLETFLTLQTPSGKSPFDRKGKAAYGYEDFLSLMDALSRRGFGWLRPQGVRKELEEMTRYWDGPLPLAGSEDGGLSPGQALKTPFRLILQTIRRQASRLSLILPAILLIVAILNINRHGIFPGMAVLLAMYFILRMFVKR